MLCLSNNKIKIIDSSVFNGLNSLQELRLSNNRITKIEEGTFKDLLIELNLETNNIVSFNKNNLVDLTNLEKVCLFDNPISSLFPTSLTYICNGNSKCNVFINPKC